MCGESFYFARFLKIFFRNWNLRKLINGGYNLIIFGQLQIPLTWLCIALKKYLYLWMLVLIKIFDKKFEAVKSGVRLWRIVISKNCRFYPKWHESIFKTKFSENNSFKSIFSKCKDKIKERFLKRKFEKILKKNSKKLFLKKFYMRKRILYFARWLKIIFHKMKSSNDWWKLRYDHFSAIFKGL